MPSARAIRGGWWAVTWERPFWLPPLHVMPRALDYSYCARGSDELFRSGAPILARHFRRHQLADAQSRTGERDRIAARCREKRSDHFEGSLGGGQPGRQQVPPLLARVAVVVAISPLRRYGLQIARSESSRALGTGRAGEGCSMIDQDELHDGDRFQNVRALSFRRPWPDFRKVSPRCRT